MEEHSLSGYIRRSSDAALQQMLRQNICREALQEIEEEIRRREQRTEVFDENGLQNGANCGMLSVIE